MSSQERLEQIVGVIKRRRWLALSALLLPLSALVTALWCMPLVYEATTTVVIERQIPENLVKTTVVDELEARLNVIGRQALRSEHLSPLVDRYQLYPEVRGRMSRARLADRMRRDIRVESQSVERKGRGEMATVSFTVTYRGFDPAITARVADDVAVLYVEENVASREAQAGTTTSFMKAQLEETKRRLLEQERRVADYKQHHAGVLPQQLAFNVVSLERLRNDLRLNADHQMRLMELRQGTEAGDEVPRDTGSDGATGAAESLAGRIARMKRELAQLRTQYTDLYPDVARLREELAQAEREAVAGDTGARRPPRGDGRRQRSVARHDETLGALKAEEARLRGEMAMYQQRIQDAPRREEEYQQLARDFEATKDAYRLMLGRADEAALAENVEKHRQGERFRIVQAASVPGEPVAPNRLRLGMYIVALCVGLAMAAVFVREHFDPSFHSITDLRAFTRVPVAAIIPKIVERGELAGRRRRGSLAAAALTSAMLVMGFGGYLVAYGNHQLVNLFVRGQSTGRSMP
jgi:protein tyrosine kinase modulator